MSYLSKEKKILDEIKGILKQDSEKSEVKLVNSIAKAKKVFVFGQGRSGLMAKSFAMRLAQIGKPSFVVGESTTPAISKNDLLLAISGSGETKTVVDIAKEAKDFGAKVVCITSKKDGALAKLCSQIIILKAKTKKDGVSIEPLGSLFEQSTLIFLDAAVLGLMDKLKVDEKEMGKRHSVLE